MQTILDKIKTLRDWQKTNQIKTHKGRNPDDLATLLNQLELDVTKTVKELEKQNDLIYDLFNKPCDQLKPLEDLWRKENPRPTFTTPNRTAFYKWIRLKILKK